MEKVERLGFGHLGNGVVVWDRTRQEYNDYMTVAHIDADRKVTYRNAVSDADKVIIENFAKTADWEISATQSKKVFNTRP